MGLPFKESTVLGGLYVRHLWGRTYAVTHGNAGFVGETFIRFMQGDIIEAPGPGDWVVFVMPVPNGVYIVDGMIARIAKSEHVPDGAAVITLISVY